MANGKSVVDVLREARGYIEKGWCQGGVGRKYNEAMEIIAQCSVDALDTACRYDLNRHALFHQARRSVAAAVDLTPGNGELVSWNDAPGRTQQEVLEAFDKAIALAEKEAQ